jgi:hypothetical protein
MDEQAEYAPEQMPQPQYGMPTPPSLELVEYLTKNQRFIVDPKKDKKDPDRIIEGDHPGEYDDAYWSVWSKDLILSNLTDEKWRYIILEKLKENECLLQISRQEEKMTIKSLINDNNQEITNISKVLRASGHDRERIQINTSTQQNLVGQINPQQRPQSSGMLSRLSNPLTWFGSPQR